MATKTEKKKVNLERLQMEIRLHYYGFAVLSGIVDWSEDDRIPTACTNGKFVKVNSDFVGSFPFPQQVFIILHELMHIARKHPMVRGNRDHQVFNLACDHYINLLLKSTCSERSEMPKENGQDVGYANKRFEDMTEFEIYDILIQEQKAGKDIFGGGRSLGDVEDLEGGEPMSQKEVETVIKSINDAIQMADAVGRMSGKGSSIWEKMAGELRDPVVPWERVLLRFLSRIFPSFRSWGHLDRRMLSMGIPYPGVVNDGTDELVFGTDCSGSMPRPVVEKALSETVNARNQCSISKMHMIYFTSNIDAHDTFSLGETPQVREDLPNGGTCLQTFFNYVKENCPAAKGIICMTDFDCGNFPEDPGIPVIWGCTPQMAKAYTPPFGEILIIPE